MSPINVSLSYLLIYRFNQMFLSTQSIEQVDGWKLFCASDDQPFSHLIDRVRRPTVHSVIYGLRQLTTWESQEFCFPKKKKISTLDGSVRFSEEYYLRLYLSGCFYLDDQQRWQSDGFMVSHRRGDVVFFTLFLCSVGLGGTLDRSTPNTLFEISGWCPMRRHSHQPPPISLCLLLQLNFYCALLMIFAWKNPLNLSVLLVVRCNSSYSRWTIWTFSLSTVIDDTLTPRLFYRLSSSSDILHSPSPALHLTTEGSFIQWYDPAVEVSFSFLLLRGDPLRTLQAGRKDCINQSLSSPKKVRESTSANHHVVSMCEREPLTSITCEIVTNTVLIYQWKSSLDRRTRSIIFVLQHP